MGESGGPGLDAEARAPLYAKAQPPKPKSGDEGNRSLVEFFGGASSSQELSYMLLGQQKSSLPPAFLVCVYLHKTSSDTNSWVSEGGSLGCCGLAAARRGFRCAQESRGAAWNANPGPALRFRGDPSVPTGLCAW